MSIAELIMQGTNRASESTAWVGDSLAKLGQQVGASLAQREQQKQAQEMLPFLQQSMQESMQLAGSGKTGEAYAKLMPFITNPSVINNPNLMPAVDAALKLNQLATNDYLKKEQLRVREDMYNARYGGGGEPLQSGADAAEQAIMREPNFTQPVDEMSGLPVMETPLTPEERAAQLGAEGQSFKMQQPEMAGPTKEAAQAQKDFAKLPAYKQASVANVAGFNALPAQQKVQAANQAVAFDPGASKYEEAKIDLGEYGIDIGSIGVPKVNEQVRIKMTASGTNDDSTVRKTFAQDFVKVGEQQYKDNQEFVSKIRDSSSKLSKERPSAGLPTFKEIFQQNGGILNATLAPASEDEESKFPFVLIPKQGAAPIPITEKQYEMIQTIQTVPAIADSTGLNLSPSKKMETAAKAPAATQGGLPATQQATPEIPDAKGNPFAEKIKKIQTTETEKNKNAVKEEIDFVVKTASRLSEALTGLSKGEYPKTLEYLPRAKQEALKGSSLENLRTEYNTLAGLKEAIDYIKNNPNTPEAAQAVKVIKQKLGI